MLHVANLSRLEVEMKSTTKGSYVRSQYITYYAGSPASVVTSTPISQAFLSTATYGPNVPDWKRRIASGLQAGTSLSAVSREPGRAVHSAKSVRSITPPWEFAFYEVVGARSTGSADWMPYHTNFELNASSAQDECIIGFLSRVGEVSKKFSSGTFAGELRETLGMLRRPLRSLDRRLGSYLSAVGKRTKGIRGNAAQQRRRRSSVVADTWLEYSFGWMPLLGDINDATKALVAMQSVRPQYERVQYSVKKNKERERYVSGPPSIVNLLGTSFNIVEDESLIVKLYGAVSVDSTSDGKRELFGLTFDDFIPTVWELIPYSFLIDYFANVGGLVDALSVRQDRIRWKMLTRVQEISARAISKNMLYPKSGESFPYRYRASDSSSMTQAKFRAIERGPYDTTLFPSLVFRIPGTGTKWANMGALFRNSRSLQNRLR